MRNSLRARRSKAHELWTSTLLRSHISTEYRDRVVLRSLTYIIWSKLDKELDLWCHTYVSKTRACPLDIFILWFNSDRTRDGFRRRQTLQTLLLTVQLSFPPPRGVVSNVQSSCIREEQWMHSSVDSNWVQKAGVSTSKLFDPYLSVPDSLKTCGDRRRLIASVIVDSQISLRVDMIREMSKIWKQEISLSAVL